MSLGYRYVMSTEQVDARPVLASALVTAIDHVGIAVADLDATIKWYHDHLGMIVLHEEVNEEQGVREAMLSVRGAPVGSAQIQLMAPLDETSTIAKFLDKRGPGLQQLAYRVSDIDSLTERLREQGVRLLYDAPRRGTADSRINFIHPKDAGGVLIELVQPASRSLTLTTTSASGCALRGAASTVCASACGPLPHARRARSATPRDELCQAGSRDRNPGIDRSWWPGRRDRPDLVVIAVGPGLDTTGRRQRCSRRLPATCSTPGHDDQSRRQNNRNSELSIPRIWS